MDGEDTSPRRALRRATGMVALVLTLCIALAGCQIALGPATQSGTPTSGTTVPIKVEHGQQGQALVLLQVKINGQGPFNFALDTGASSSLVDRAVARQTGLKRAGSNETISGVGGSQQAIPVDVTRWSVGSLTLPHAQIDAATLPGAQQSLQGLVGSDIWNQFGRVTIDYSASTLTVYKTFAATGAVGIGPTAERVGRRPTE